MSFPNLLSALVLVASSLALAAPAAAQRETFSSRDVSLALDDHHAAAVGDGAQLTLRAPEPGDYALPVVGIVVGSLMTLAGVGTLLGGGLVLAIQRGFDRDTTSTELALGLGAAGAAVGLSFLVAGATTVSGLRGRARDAERARIAPVLAISPIEGGMMFVAGGEY